ncbi:MAG: HdeD family acid-resistance protein [Anaerorhabdus sp.]
MRIKREEISAISIAASGILYIIAGILMIMWRNFTPYAFKFIIFSYMCIMSVLELLSCLNKFKLRKLLSALVPITFGAIFAFKTSLISSLFAFSLGIYIIVMAIIRLIDFIILNNNKIPGRFFTLFNSIIMFMFSLPLINSPKEYNSRAILIAGIFCIFYGLTNLGDFLVEIAPMKSSDNYKRKFRINLPIIFTALLPRQTIGHINKMLDVVEDDLEEDSFKEDTTADLEIFVHVTESGFGTMGHADFYFEGKVYCYGNYDFQSYKLFDSVGDGVLFTVNDYDKYIKFCAMATSDSIFSFGLKLTDNQKNNVREKINDILKITYPWYSLAEKVERKELSEDADVSDYASHLYLETNAKMYKFKSSSFKTYFVMSTNCVKLVDTILRGANITAARPNGILTPGSFYEFLDRRYRLKNSIVISKKTYHHDAKIIHDKKIL